MGIRVTRPFIVSFIPGDQYGGPDCFYNHALTLTLYSSSTSFLEYQAGGGKGLVDLVNQLTLERCHSF